MLSGGAKGPGLFFVLPCIDNVITTDLRTITFDVPPQEILTKDSVTTTVDAVIYFRVSDPKIKDLKTTKKRHETEKSCI